MGIIMLRNCMLVILTLITCAYARSQVVNVVVPAHNATGVSKNLSSISVDTDYPLDSSSVEEAAYGSDSTTGGWSRKIHLLTKHLYDSLGGDINYIRRASERGTLVHVNDTTARLDVYSGLLSYATRYCIVVDGFRVVIDTNGTPDAVAVPQVVTEFETELAPHYVTSFTPSDGLFRCGDTLKIQFNRKVTTTSNGSGPLARFIEYDTPLLADSTRVTWDEDTISATVSLSVDSLTLFVQTSGLSDGPKRLSIRPTIMTGDPNDTASYWIEKHTVAAIYMKPKPSSTGLSLPAELLEYQGDIPTVYHAGDTVILTAPATHDSLYFVKWECAADPLVDNSSSRIITRTYSCSDLDRIDAHPIYSKKSKDTIQITISGSSYGFVRVEGWVDSLGSNTYTVWRGSTHGLTLAAIPTSNGKLNSWSSSSYPAIHGSISSNIVIFPGIGYWQNGRQILIGVGFDPKPVLPCTQHALTVTLDGEQYSSLSPRTPFQPLDYATVVTNPNMGIANAGQYSATGQRNENNQFNQYVSVTVNDACYEIQCIVLDGVLIAGSYDVDYPVGPTWNGTIAVATPNCNRRLEIFLRKVTYLLTLEIVGLNGTILDIKNESISSSPEGRIVQEWRRSSGKAKYTKVAEYVCDEDVTLTPFIDKTDFNNKYKEIVGWNTSSGYTHTAVIDVPKKIIRFTMDEDRTAQLRFEEDVFLATHLILETNSPVKYIPEEGPIEWTFAIDNSGQIPDQTTLSRVRVEFEGSGANQLVSPVIRFNKTVSEASVKSTVKNDGTYDIERLHSRDYLNSRVDRNPERAYYNELDIPNPNEAEIFLRADAFGGLASQDAWCSGKFRLDWSAGIYSTETGNPTLANPGFTTLEIAPPKISVHLTRLEVLDEDGWDWGNIILFGLIDDDPEISVISASSLRTISPVGPDMVSMAEDPVRDGVYDGMGEGEVKNPNQLIAVYEPLDNNGTLFLTFDVLDEDPAMPSLAGTLTKIADGLAGIAGQGLKTDQDYINAGIAIVISALADLIAGDGPDHVASLSPETGGHTFGANVWGGMPQTPTSAPLKSLEHERRNGYFSLKYTIKLEPR